MIPAILCKKVLRKPLHIWVLDIWPYSVIGGGIKSNFIPSFLKKLCVLIYSAADVLFLSSNGFKYKLNEMGVVVAKLVYFPQWIDADYLDELQLGSLRDAGISLVSSIKKWVVITVPCLA